MRSMKRPIGVPVLHMRGDADPYVLADPVHRTQRYAPHGRYVSITGAGHFGHEEQPEAVNEQLSRFLAQLPAEADQELMHVPVATRWVLPTLAS